jgi:pectate lyase
MSLEHSSPEVIRAVDAGVRWFEAVKLAGIRQVSVNGDKKIVPDKSAPPLWARFYEIGTNRPIFCDRDGVIRDDLAAIGHERRNGYAWYGSWGEALPRRYARWRVALPRPQAGAP